MPHLRERPPCASKPYADFCVEAATIAGAYEPERAAERIAAIEHEIHARAAGCGAGAHLAVKAAESHSCAHEILTTAARAELGRGRAAQEPTLPLRAYRTSRTAAAS